MPATKPKGTTGLKRLYRGNSTAKLLLDYLASRDRNRANTHFDRVLGILTQTDQPPTRQSLRDVFRKFETLGVGRFVIGRRGHPTRFEWTTPLIDVGTTAQMPARAYTYKKKVGKRGPGRPRKEPAVAEQPVKRGPGRPRKVVEPVAETPVKRGPGRPRKVVVSEQVAA